MSEDRIKTMSQNLLKRLRKRLFNMDNRGEGFPAFVIPIVVKAAPKTLRAYPEELEQVVIDCMRLIESDFKKEAYESIEGMEPILDQIKLEIEILEREYECKIIHNTVDTIVRASAHEDFTHETEEGEVYTKPVVTCFTFLCMSAGNNWTECYVSKSAIEAAYMEIQRLDALEPIKSRQTMERPKPKRRKVKKGIRRKG